MPIISCLHCNSPKEVLQKEINRGNGKFCSQSCSSKYNRAQEKKPDNTTCSYCSMTFYRNDSKKAISRSGFQFCSRQCKDAAQQIINKEIFRDMMPSHYKDGEGIKYRQLAIRMKEMKCERCGYDKIPEVNEVHHKDGDRTNNTIDNLEILCPNCHTEHHYMKRNLVEDIGNAPIRQESCKDSPVALTIPQF